MEFLNRYLKNDVFMVSIALILLSNFASLINFIFQFIMARMLDSNNFGILAFVISLIFLFGVPSLAIQTAISRKTTKLYIEGKNGKIRGLFNYATKKLFLVSAILIIIFIFISYFTYQKLNIPLDVLVISSLFIVFGLTLPVIWGIMQGTKKFMVLGWNNILNSSAKLILGIILVYFGFQVYGAIIGLLFGAFIAWLAGILIIAGFKPEKEDIRLFSKEEIFPFIALLIITLMYSLDILIGKFAFSPEILGSYAKISLIGKIILFSCSSVSLVMFPLSSERHLAGNKPYGVIKKSSLLVGLICLASLLLIFFFPDLIIGILFGKSYLSVAHLLFPAGIAFSASSCLTLLVMYKIAVNQFSLKETAILCALLLLQIASMILFIENIEKFVNVFMASSLVIFIFMFLITAKWKE